MQPGKQTSCIILFHNCVRYILRVSRNSLEMWKYYSETSLLFLEYGLLYQLVNGRCKIWMEPVAEET